MAYKRLGDMLLEANKINEEQLRQALEFQKETGQRLGMVLVKAGIITEEDLIDALRVQLHVDFVDLSSEMPNPALADLVPKKLAREHFVVPVRAVDNTLYLAMVDPLDFVALDEAKAATQMNIVPLIATSSATERMLINLYGADNANQALEELQMEEGDSRASEGGVQSHQIDSDDEEAAPIIRLVNSIIERAVNENASDIHIEPRETELTVRLRTDGVLRQILSVPKKSQAAVISRIKIIGSMDIAERRIPQDGRANVRARGQDIDLRISSLPTIYGEKIVIRLLRKNTEMLNFDGVGLSGDNQEKVVSLISNSNGVILIVGPTGSGKSSTMTAIMTSLNQEDVNLVTLEDPVEYNIDGVNQVQINEKTGMTFANGLRSILRQDPDIISVGEIRDGETSEIAMRSAITGHLVISTLHTNDAPSTVDRLLDMGTPRFLIHSAMRGVISQRLVRRICPRCKEEYIPDDEELRKSGLTREEANQHVFYRGKGCPDCHDSGYRGRIAVFEIMMFSQRVQRVIAESGSRADLDAALEADGFRTLRDDCLRVVYEGTSTLAELIRTVNTV